MTLLALLHVDGVPVLIGDILITGSETEDQPPVEIPTKESDSEVRLRDSGNVILSIEQKINVLGENLLVGWAGSKFAARTVIKELRIRNDQNSFDRHSLQQFFDEMYSHPLDWVANQDVAFICLLHDREGAFVSDYSFNNCSRLSVPSEYGEITLYGTGSGDLAILASQTERPASTKTDSYSPLQKATIAALSLTGWLYLYEHGTGESLSQGYGGAFEIATYIEGRWAKLADITYLYWLLLGNQNLERLVPYPFGFKISYASNLLFVSRFKIGSVTNEPIDPSPELIEFEITGEQIYYISPIFEESASEQELVISGLNSQFTCNYILAVVDNGSSKVACVPIHTPEPSMQRIIFFCSQERQTMAVNKNFHQYLFGQAENLLQNA